MNQTPIRIATRTSNLALWQANYTADLLRKIAPDREIELVHVSTVGDRDQSEPLHQFPALGVFTREVQKVVLEGNADLAVHSLKDLPTEPVDGLTLAAVPDRAPKFDALVLSASSEVEIDPAKPLDVLPPGARVGTGSIRRQAQLLHHRDDLKLSGVRGNVETRLRKLDAGEYDALVLAAAGLQRLGLGDRISALLGYPLLFPAVGQGALGIECRCDDAEIRSLLAQLTDQKTFSAVTAERSVLSELRAGCHAPLGVMTSLENDRLTLEAVVLSHDGTERIIASATGTVEDAASLGVTVAENLKQQGADRLVQAARENTDS